MFLAVLWLVVYYGWFASEVYIGIATRTRRSSGNVRDRGTLLLLWVVIAGSVTASIWISKASGPNMPGMLSALLPWLELAATVTLLTGLALRWAAIVSLGKSFSSNVAIHSTQTVLKTGLYRRMRHPSYTGLMLCFLGVGLHTRNWISLVILMVAPTLALMYRIHVEEIALREHFGREYVEYSRETKRLIPGIY